MSVYFFNKVFRISPEAAHFFNEKLIRQSSSAFSFNYSSAFTMSPFFSYISFSLIYRLLKIAVKFYLLIVISERLSFLPRTISQYCLMKSPLFSLPTISSAYYLLILLNLTNYEVSAWEVTFFSDFTQRFWHSYKNLPYYAPVLIALWGDLEKYVTKSSNLGKLDDSLTIVFTKLRKFGISSMLRATWTYQLQM